MDLSAMKTVFSIPILLSASLLGSCQNPAEVMGPQRVQVIALDAPAGEYTLAVRELLTLENARTLEGSSVRMRGGGAVVLEDTLIDGDLSGQTEEELAEVQLVNGDRAIQAQFEIENGVLIPTDWESLIMFSFYHHLEAGRAFFAELGVPASALGPVTTYFNIRVTSLLFFWGAPLITDNAGYTPIADAFLLFPSLILSDSIPLAANEGVVVHELSHAIKHRMLHPNKKLPPYVTEKWTVSASNAYRSDDEGIADFFAAITTQQTNFIAPSLDLPELDRDLSQPRNFTSELFEAQNTKIENYDPYPLGSCLAAWLWSIGENQNDRLRVGKAVIDAFQTMESILNTDYSLAQLLNHIVAHLENEDKERACTLLDSRLEGQFREVPQCDIE